MENGYFAPDAVALVKGKMLPSILGKVVFYQKTDYVLVVAEVSGLPQTDTGFYGFHIHEGERCSGANFADTKNHYNPANTTHPRHAGDLPPLLYVNGDAYLAVHTDRFTAEEIIGRTVVIHSGPDDFTTQPAGNAGTKIACGEIIRA